MRLSQTSPRILVGPKRSLRHVRQARDFHANSQNLRFSPREEGLVSLVSSKLNAEFAFGRERVQRIRMFFGFEALLPQI